VVDFRVSSEYCDAMSGKKMHRHVRDGTGSTEVLDLGALVHLQCQGSVRVMIWAEFKFLRRSKNLRFFGATAARKFALRAARRGEFREFRRGNRRIRWRASRALGNFARNCPQCAKKISAHNVQAKGAKFVRRALRRTLVTVKKKWDRHFRAVKKERKEAKERKNVGEI